MVEQNIKQKQEKSVVGLIEKIQIIGSKNTLTRTALFDTGATTTSVNLRTAAKAGIGPIVGTVKIKNASMGSGFSRRPIAEATLIVKGRTIKTNVNVVDREEQSYQILIGRDIIHNNFYVDVSKTHKSKKVKDLKD
ncbi:MAG: RimK/LysX family protein [Candidatus ainarchaeum sp.]|nr:RimK/LysX family protein [Candidatus ainarchaeum sp.]